MPKVKTKRKTNHKKGHKAKKRSKLMPKTNTAIIIITIIVVLAVILSVVLAPHGRKLPNPLPELNKDIATGVDISEHNGSVDWQALKDEVDFAIIRVGYTGYSLGNNCIDKNAEENLKNANAAGIPVGVYYYTQATDEKEAKQEAKLVLKVIKNYNISLPVFIDYEYAQRDGEFVGRLYDSAQNTEESINIINAFCQTIEKSGYSSGIYASVSFLEDKINMKNLNESSYIWIAHYSDKLSYKSDYDIWQYTEKGELDCVESDYVDMNYWYL